MWVETAEGAAFVPNDLDFSQFSSFGDEAFPEYFENMDRLVNLLEESGDLPVFYRALFQREAQTFSPRLTGKRVADRAYLTKPFQPFHIFDTIESFHYADAAQYAWEVPASARPYSKKVICNVHSRLFPNHQAAGVFRKAPVWLSRRRDDPATRLLMLAPAKHVGPSLHRMAQFLEKAPRTHRLALSAMAHFQFIALHPFFDGNGRVARATMPTLLRYFGLLDRPCLFVSETLLDWRWDYFYRAEALERFDEIEAWIRFFVAVLVEQAKRSTEFLRLVVSIRDGLVERFRARFKSAVAEHFADQVLLSPSFRASQAAQILGMAPAEGINMLNTLVGTYGLSRIVVGDDPLFQFGDIYELLSH